MEIVSVLEILDLIESSDPLTALALMASIPVRWRKLRTARSYAGWARERFGWRFSATSALRSLVPLNKVVRVPSRVGDIWLRPGTADLAVYDEVVRNDSYGFKLPTEPKVIVDAGAHIGLSARMFAHRYPRALIACVEPDASNAALAIRNTAHLPNVLVRQGALWSHRTALTIKNPNADTWSYRIGQLTRLEDEAVPAYGIPDVMEDLGVDRIDLLKMDIEGAEIEVFQSAITWIHKVGAMVVELHDRFRPGCTDAFNAAIGSGFMPLHVQGDVHVLVNVNQWVPTEV